MVLLYVLEEMSYTYFSYARGHLVGTVDGQVWRYVDNGELYDDSRLCEECNLPHWPDGPDACLGFRPGIKSACCGHGGRVESIWMVNLRIGGGT